MQDRLIQEQLDYYRARATEYDASLAGAGETEGNFDLAENRELDQAAQALRELGPCAKVLELAGGTGIWTLELARLAFELTVLDGSPEMLAINRAKVKDPNVRYICVDLFDWSPDQRYDLVFFSFWLSHVPPDRLADFLGRVADAVADGGHVFILDEPAGGRMLSGPVADGMFQERTLQDGRVFNIVKVYYDPLQLMETFRRQGFTPRGLVSGKYFYYLCAKKG